ncbi:MAG: nicotinate phosphoribosyltransferase [Actinomycetia bacterium]|nr:nicotinate phosphoribosyltransferase [Actinomycetes bacterium]
MYSEQDGLVGGGTMSGSACAADGGCALRTDLYQLTMAQGYFLAGMHERPACFVLNFRSNPFEGGFAVAAGLGPVLEYLRDWRFSPEELDYLSVLPAPDGSRLFKPDFIAHLRDLRLTVEIVAIPEGEICFAQEPLLRITGPIEQCQLLETPLLNIINFSTLIATKAARCVLAAQGAPLLEFGLRRAQGPDGALLASRAAYIGGCSATSNVEAGQRFGIPVAGTHGHSWVMAFDDELTAFRAYAQSAPNNLVLLVDTYDTLQGVRNAITVGRELAEQDRRLLGIRIDSGDLAWRSKQARVLLDEAGFKTTKIYCSNELDEYTIASLKDQGAPIDVWAVGTRLATGYPAAALGGVYKLSALAGDDGVWQPRLKLSDQSAKTTTPGLQGLRRYYRFDGGLDGDCVYDTQNPPAVETVTMFDPTDMTRSKTFAAEARFRELLHLVVSKGKPCVSFPQFDLSEIRDRTLTGLGMLDESHKRFLRPHSYPVGLETQLARTRLRLIAAARGTDESVLFEEAQTKR